MTWLTRQWQSRSAASTLLLPLAWLFGFVAAVRRSLFRHRLLPRTRLPVPVIVVGNIAVGGTGKTPLVLWLAAYLAEHGYRPGIITRGYGGAARGPERVTPASPPVRCGDEAVLLARRASCPVWIGRDRGAAGRALLAADSDCNVILSDDGLQHYALERDVEIAVIDGERGHGNARLLPAGPLREPCARLATVNAIVVHGTTAAKLPAAVPHFAMRLAGRRFYNLANPAHRVDPEYFRHRTVHAVAGIGHPERFFQQLQALGITFSARPYPDHHPFRAEDFEGARADAIVMTEKDAVKCQRFATERYWVLPVDAQVDTALGDLVLGKLDQR